MGNMYLYLVLSLLSGILETGAFTVGVATFGIPMGLALALAYQVGCLVRNPLGLSMRGAAVSLCGALLLLPYAAGSAFPMLLLVALVSGGVQSAREWLLPKHRPMPVSTKRMVRVVGFVLGLLGGALIGYPIIVCVSIVACLAVLPTAFTQAQRTSWIHLNRWVASDGCGWIMLIHQTHYFAYVYVLLALLLEPTGMQAPEVNIQRAMTASVWFAMGWFSYISGELVLKVLLQMPSRKAAITGHLWVAICLLGMVLATNHPFLLGLAWVLGGFGGGSVYAIKDLAKENACSADIELWEHWGHVIGVSLSLVAVLLFPHELTVPFFLAFTAALGTLSLVMYPRFLSTQDVTEPVE